jgi:hypothetical protein
MYLFINRNHCITTINNNPFIKLFMEFRLKFIDICLKSSFVTLLDAFTSIATILFEYSKIKSISFLSVVP